MIKAIYPNLNDMKEDSLILLEEYINEVQLEDYSLDEIVKIVPTLIDVFHMTYASRLETPKTKLETSIHNDTVNLLSESFEILYGVRNDDEICNNKINSSVIKLLHKLKKTLDIMKIDEVDLDMDEEMTNEVYLSLGLTNESE